MKSPDYDRNRQLFGLDLMFDADGNRLSELDRYGKVGEDHGCGHVEYAD